MTQKVTPIQTTVGFISGRDTIYLKGVIFVNDNEYCIKGQLNGYNCSSQDKILVEDNVTLPFSLNFKGVLLWRAVELDYAEHELNIETDSCFDLIEHSEKIAKISALDKAAQVGKINRGYDKNGHWSCEIWHQHFVLRTYDTVFEIIAQSYDLVIGQPEAPVYISVEDALKN